MTEHMYIKYPDVFEATVRVIGQGNDSRGAYLVFSRSLFYPQGGGQPADQGNVVARGVAYKIYDVRNVDGEMRHYIEPGAHAVYAGDTVAISVDKSRRQINSGYHTAGHLIAVITEGIASELTAVKGHHFPGEAYVEFDGIVEMQEKFLNELTEAMKDTIHSEATVKVEELTASDAKKIFENLPHSFFQDKKFRVSYIEGFNPVPCGGTHVKKLKDLGIVRIDKCKSKKGKTKIYYKVL